MSDTAATAADASQQPGAAADAGNGAGDPTPPWGSAEDFNPDKAWSLIQNLRGDIDAAKAKSADAEALRAQLKEHEDAKLSAEEKAARDADELKTTNSSLSLENARLMAVLEHDALTIDDLALIGGTTADEVKEAAAKLAARLGSGTPTAPPTARPSATALRGGGDPTVPATQQDWLRTALSQTNQ